MMLRLQRSLILISTCCIMLLMSCGDDFDADAQRALDDAALQAYFAENNINPQKTASGLYYVIDDPGSSEKPTRSATVTVDYRGFYLDGVQFDSSFDRGEPSQFSLRNVILGWAEGIPLFGVGGKGSLYIISELGYGPEGRGAIPENAPLAFDIELISIP